MLLEDFAIKVEGIGCVMREWREDVRLGTIPTSTCWSRVPGRVFSRVAGLTKELWSRSEGAMATVRWTVPSTRSVGEYERVTTGLKRELGFPVGGGRSDSFCREAICGSRPMDMAWIEELDGSCQCVPKSLVTAST